MTYTLVEISKFSGGKESLAIRNQCLAKSDFFIFCSCHRHIKKGFPMSDFRVTLVDGKEHNVDSSEMAFKIAACLAFKECMKQAKPTLLEPIMTVEIQTTEEFMGDLMGDLNSRRGRVQGMDSVGSGQMVRAQVPLSEMLTYSQTLKSITGGRGSFSMSMSHYEEVPAQTQQKIIADTQKAKEEE